MPEFLVDVNLPYHFSLWKGNDYIHQNDINLQPRRLSVSLSSSFAPE